MLKSPLTTVLKYFIFIHDHNNVGANIAKSEKCNNAMDCAQIYHVTHSAEESQ